MPQQQEPAMGWHEVLGQHGGNPPNDRVIGFPIQYEGEQHLVSSCENRIKAQFEQWMKSNALIWFSEMQSMLNPEELRDFRAAFMADVAIGTYTWDGSATRKAIKDIPGMKQLFFLLLRRCNKKMTPELSTKIMESDVAAARQAIQWAVSGNSELPADLPGMKTEPTMTTPPTLDG